eukprot:m.1654019 g.1654019  ORF g.1654019 m.1654019 type:complete len:62 (-) comp100379_c0_seq1:116-301(-)
MQSQCVMRKSINEADDHHTNEMVSHDIVAHQKNLFSGMNGTTSDQLLLCMNNAYVAASPSS